MAKVKKEFACNSCNYKKNKIWGEEDEYISHHYTYELVFNCKKNQEPPKIGVACPKWKQASNYRKILNNRIERTYKIEYQTFNDMEDWEKDLEFYGIDDMPGCRD